MLLLVRGIIYSLLFPFWICTHLSNYQHHRMAHPKVPCLLCAHLEHDIIQLETRPTTASSTDAPSFHVPVVSEEKSLKASTLARTNRSPTSPNTSSDSSISGCPSRSSIAGHESLSSASYRTTSPHDLSCATSRSRAPILRVFVPCTKLDDDDESLISCERQHVDSGCGHIFQLVT